MSDGPTHLRNVICGAGRAKPTRKRTAIRLKAKPKPKSRRQLRRLHVSSDCDDDALCRGPASRASVSAVRRELRGIALSRRNATSAGVNALVALLMVSGFAALAHAAEAPDNVEAEVNDAVQSCKDLEGKPNADAVLKVEDVNGDGGEDWIADYSKLKCDGGINQMCEDDGCTLQIFLSRHGGSPAPAGPYSIEDLALDVIGLLDEQQVDRAHVVGLSLGGMVAQQIAAQQPHRVDRLVLLCTSAHADRQPWTERAAAVRAGGTGAIADAAVGRWLTSRYRLAHPEVAAGLREMLVSIDDEGYAACCEAIADMDLRPGLSRIQAPTLVIAGAEDPSMPPEQMRAMAAAIAGSRFEVVPGAHVPPLEHPDAVTRLLLEHLAGA